MKLNQENMKKIRKLILFAGIVVLVLLKFDVLWDTLVFFWEIIQPFLVGGMIAFVINLPMNFFENKILLGRKKKKGAKEPAAVGSAVRAFSILLSYLVVILLVTIVSITVIPQLAATVSIIVEKTPRFFQGLSAQLQTVL